jgi:uncharacterized protein YceH (UPF0502 family)
MTTFAEGTILSAEEARVVGALAEKQLTTPDYYPLTLNALVNACNQISNRDPVVAYDEQRVSRAIESLRAKGLAREVRTADGRVPKYRHVLDEALALSKAELALMCVLLLRGAQTPGELRTRTERLYPFSGTQFVESALEGLMTREGRASLVFKLPRAQGQKESRYAQLLTGEIAFDENESASDAARRSPRGARGDAERVAALEEELRAVRGELEELKRQFDEFRKQFD